MSCFNLDTNSCELYLITLLEFIRYKKKRKSEYVSSSPHLNNAITIVLVINWRERRSSSLACLALMSCNDNLQVQIF